MKNKKVYQKSGATMQTVAPQPISLKRRIACFALLGLFLFWTIGSVIAIWLGISSSKDSAMITADAAPPVSSDASNQLAFEFELVGLSYSTFYANNGNQQMFDSAMTYKVNFYADGHGLSLKFYSYDNPSSSSNLYLDGPVLSLTQPFTSNGTSLIVENFGREEQFFVQYDSGNSLPSITEIPVQVSYVGSSRVHNTLSYMGYNIYLYFLSDTGSIRRYDMFFGVYGTNFFCPLAGTNSRFFDIPIAPLTYQQFADYNLNAANIQELNAEITRLQNEYYRALQNAEDEYIRGYGEGQSAGYNQGYDVGYNVGFPAGVADANHYSFVGLISAVIDVPVSAFTSLFNFELLGFNLAEFFFGVITLVVVIKLLKWFL